jgi:hypothetical protein
MMVRHGVRVGAGGTSHIKLRIVYEKGIKSWIFWE